MYKAEESGDVPCDKMKPKLLFSAKLTRASPAGFFNLMSPSLSQHIGIATAEQAFVQLEDS
jgi:hypothetical protein